MTELFEPMIKVIDLYKAFGPKKVLQGASLEINKGESMVSSEGAGQGRASL